MLAPPESRPGPGLLPSSAGHRAQACSPAPLQPTWCQSRHTGRWGCAEMARPTSGVLLLELPSQMDPECHKAGPWGDTLTVCGPGLLAQRLQELPRDRMLASGVATGEDLAPVLLHPLSDEGRQQEARSLPRAAPSPQSGPVFAAGSAQPISFPSGSSRLSCGAWSAAPASCGLTTSLCLPCGLLPQVGRGSR